MGVLVGLIIVVVIGMIIFLHFASEYAFKKSFHEHKKNKEEALVVLKNRQMSDEEIYDEVDMKEVSIESKDGLRLQGCLVEKYNESKKYIILVHGYSANRHIHMPFTRVFLNEGFNILIVDQRNHGESEGEFPSYGYYERDDIDLWIDFLKNRVGNDVYIGLHGQSMSGATVLMCGARNSNVKFIIDDCGYSSGKEEIKYQMSKHKWVPFLPVYKVLNYKVKNRYGFRFEDVSPIDDIMKCDKPILFIHGNADVTVPYEMAVDMYNRRNNKKDRLLIVDGSGHMTCYRDKKDEYEMLVHEIIANANLDI